MITTPNSKDHFVPQFLLRRFLLDGDAKFWSVDFDSRTAHNASLGSVCHDNGHDFIMRYGEFDADLSELSRDRIKSWEDCAGEALNRVCRERPQATDIGALLGLAAMLIVKAPYRRAIQSMQAATLPHLSRPKSLNVHQAWMKEHELTALFTKQRWTLWRSSGSSGEEFITSDAPVVPIAATEEELANPPPSDPAFLAGWDTGRIHFPISRTLALVRGGDGTLYRQANSAMVAAYNQAMVDWANWRWNAMSRYQLIPGKFARHDAAEVYRPRILAGSLDALVRQNGGTVPIGSGLRISLA